MCTIATFIFLLMIYYLQSIQGIDIKFWDIKNVTVGDYTVELTVTHSMWNKFRSLKSQLKFDEYLKSEIESKVKSLPNALVGHDNDEIEVAGISLAFSNGALIKVLKKRGKIIAYGKYQELQHVDEALNHIIENHQEKMTTPIKAFVTFSNQEGFERCSKNLCQLTESGERNRKIKKWKLLGSTAKLNYAPEPSNIIWENLEISGFRMKCKRCQVYAIVLAFLVGMFILFSILKSVSGKNKLKYPATVNCEHLDALFDSQSEYLQFAGND